MKRQIALVGGQIVPIYLGIREKEPKHVHLIYSAELKAKVSTLKSEFNTISFHDHITDAYSFEDITSIVESLIFEYEDDQWELNLTGGTKIMTLAAHNIFKEFDFESFYLDQNSRLFSLKTKTFSNTKTNIKIATFLRLSGHNKIRKSDLTAYSSEEFDIADKMLDLMQDQDVDLLFRKIASEIEDFNINNYSKKINNSTYVDWSHNCLTIKTKSISEQIYNSKALKICFSGLWWEMVTANAVRRWEHKKELLVGVEMLANSDHKFAKNEIDIILNTGKNMIFIECKSGNVNQSDINKMRVVKRMYGGISSRSILVCFKLPRKDILERCIDLDIDVFALQRRSKSKHKGFVPISSMNQLNTKLTELVNKNQI